MQRRSRIEVWATLALLLTAAFFRLYRLDQLPPGMYSDIGVNGLDALDVLEGRLAVFFPRNFGREALFIYWQALLVGLVGVHPIVFAFSGVAMGMLGIALVYRLHRELFGTAIALLGTALLALSFWHVDLTRIGLRGVSLLPFVALCLLFLWRTLRHGRPGDAAIAGAALGLAQYTYISARLLPVLVVLVCVADWRAALERWRQLLLAAAVAVVVFAPEGMYFVRHRDDLLRRAADVSVFNPTPEIEGKRNTLGEAVLNTAGMFFIRGDENQRHNLAPRPIFDPAFALLFVVGTGIALWRSRRSVAYRWVLLWMIVMSVPSALSHESPNWFRTQSSAPPVFLLPALTIVEAARRIPRLGPVVALAVVIVWGSMTYRLYFDEWASDPRTYWAFDGNLTRIAALIESRPEPWVYISLDRRPVVELLAPRSRLEARWYREESFALPVPAHTSGDVLYVSAPTAALAEAAPTMLAGVRPLDNTHGPLGRPDFRAFVWPESAIAAELGRRSAIRVEMAPDFRLIGFSTSTVGAETVIRLFWQPLAPRGPYDLYVHIRDADGKQVGQSDRLVWPIDEGPPREDLLMTVHPFRLAPGAYTAEAGAVHRSPTDRAQLIGGPIGDVAEIPIRVP